ncbi:rRNA methyltransferase [Robertmurraya andreesenii]|uniref:rRNA methyltransferase n=1 Tax=Anoxybacillus andreesenii TaxID=1325932 RepID=A0ABT9V0P7_9BACL|nr:rRNA methyltransferase [Robertmurraya andreesenii]MDQ0154526.1 hypothetical protein [Robertmurraya andreesenii]
MWKKTRDGLIAITDTTRIAFRTNISRACLDQLQLMAQEYNTHVNYLIENGLKNLLSHGSIQYNKDLRPKDRIQYKSTYDKELLNKTRDFAKEQHLFINDVIEYSINYIDVSTLKNQSHRHRIE